MEKTIEILKHIKSLAGKLLAEGLTINYTKEEAINKTKTVVAPVYIRKLIENFDSEIREEMQKCIEKR